MDEQAEYEKRDVWVREQILSICKEERDMLGLANLKRLYNQMYWRDRYFELLLEKEKKA